MTAPYPTRDPLTRMVCPHCQKRRPMRYFAGRWDCWGCGWSGVLRVEVASRWRRVRG